MSSQSSAEARHEAQPPEYGQQAAQGRTSSLERAHYLRLAGGGLVAAFLGSVVKPPEFRAQDGASLLVFSAVPDGARHPDEIVAPVLVEYGGDDQEGLAAQLLRNTQVYAEGSLRLSTWVGKGGAEHSGLRIEATHIEVMSQ